MPIEIRELIIKTEVSTSIIDTQRMKNQDLSKLKNEVLEACKRMLQAEYKKQNNRR